MQVLVLLMRYALGDLHKMKQFVVGKASKVRKPSSSNLSTPCHHYITTCMCIASLLHRS